jgi:hypothetical protein
VRTAWVIEPRRANPAALLITEGLDTSIIGLNREQVEVAEIELPVASGNGGERRLSRARRDCLIGPWIPQKLANEPLGSGTRACWEWSLTGTLGRTAIEQCHRFALMRIPLNPSSDEPIGELASARSDSRARTWAQLRSRRGQFVCQSRRRPRDGRQMRDKRVQTGLHTWDAREIQITSCHSRLPHVGSRRGKGISRRVKFYVIGGACSKPFARQEGCKSSSGCLCIFTKTEGSPAA